MVSLHSDLTRITLAVLFIGGLLLAGFWVMQPFLPAIVWATTLVLATWPLMLWVQRHLGGRRGLAVLVMTIALLLVVIVPLWLAVSTVITNMDNIADIIRTVLSLKIPPPPDWLAAVPVFGRWAAETWAKLTSVGVQELAPKLAPYAGTLTQWLASAVGSLGAVLVNFLLITALAGLMYAKGEYAAAAALRFGHRLGGDRGATVVRLAGQAIRSVALGVVITAVAQSLIAGLGLAVAGVPFAALLTALILLLCLIQLGPAVVMVPAVIWLYFSGETLRGTVLLVFMIVAVTIDQFIRPILIRRGADLPMILILGGVIGGLIAFGILGIFIGPTVLAVAYTLLNAWMAEDDEQEPSAAYPEA